MSVPPKAILECLCSSAGDALLRATLFELHDRGADHVGLVITPGGQNGALSDVSSTSGGAVFHLVRLYLWPLEELCPGRV